MLFADRVASLDTQLFTHIGSESSREPKASSMTARYRVVDGRILNRRCEINVAERRYLSCRG